jgi:hypothetical protein
MAEAGVGLDMERSILSLPVKVEQVAGLSRSRRNRASKSAARYSPVVVVDEVAAPPFSISTPSSPGENGLGVEEEAVEPAAP